MARYKLYGILSLFIFAFPKLFMTTFGMRENSNKIKDTNHPLSLAIPLEQQIKPIQVSASVYFPVEEQTDSTPYITADGSKINEEKPGQHRWVAVSRDLLRKWGGTIDYGDTLYVKGLNRQMDGIYIVRDTMKKRIKNRIDILVGENDDIMGFWDNVKVYNVNYN